MVGGGRCKPPILIQPPTGVEGDGFFSIAESVGAVIFPFFDGLMAVKCRNDGGWPP